MLAETRIPGDGQQDSGEELVGQDPGVGVGEGPGSQGEGTRIPGENDGVSTGATPLVTIKRSRSECPTFLCSVSWGWGRGVQSYTNHLQLKEVKASADSNSDRRSTLELLAELGSSVTLCPVLRHSVLFCDTLSCSATLCPIL